VVVGTLSGAYYFSAILYVLMKFTSHDQLNPQQKHLLPVEEIQHSDWLICQSASKFVVRQVVSLMKNEQQSQNLLHKVDPRSTFRNNLRG